MYCSHITNGIDPVPDCPQCKDRMQAAHNDITNAKHASRRRMRKSDVVLGPSVDLWADDLSDYEVYPCHSKSIAVSRGNE